jgi:RNA polymerase sigma factor (sigma-70 family)
MSITPVQIEDLYRAHAPDLHLVVGSGVGTTASTIEDACQVAWSRLLDHTERVRAEAAFSWLTTTAVREAARLSRASRRDCSLEAELERCGDGILPAASLDPAERSEARERLGRLTQLPLRERRVLWLRGLGFSYEEIARREGCTERAVHRLIARARRATRAAA